MLEEKQLGVALMPLQPAEGCVALPAQPQPAAVHSWCRAGCSVGLTLGRQVDLDCCSIDVCSVVPVLKAMARVENNL